MVGDGFPAAAQRQVGSRMAVALVAITFIFLTVGAAWGGERQDSTPGDLPEGYFALMGDVVTQFGERFGGGWITWDDATPTVHIGVVNPTAEEISETTSRSMPGLDVDVVPVKYSKLELDAFAETIGSIVFPGPSAVVKISPASDINKVKVLATSDDDPVLARIRAAIPEDALLVTVEPGARLVASPGRHKSSRPVILFALGTLVLMIGVRRMQRRRQLQFSR